MGIRAAAFLVGWLLATLVPALTQQAIAQQAIAQQATPTPPGGGRCGATDLVFAIDDTFSLATAIREMKREAEHIVDLAWKLAGGELRLGLVTFKDQVDIDLDLGQSAFRTTGTSAESYNPYREKQAFIQILRGIQAEGGGAGPEASDEALRSIIFALPASQKRPQKGDFRGQWAGQTRILILITDNLPGGFDDLFTPDIDDRSAADLAQAARDQAIHIAAIYVPTRHNLIPLDPRVADIMRNYAAATGGIFAITEESGTGVAEAIGQIINQCGIQPIS